MKSLPPLRGKLFSLVRATLVAVLFVTAGVLAIAAQDKKAAKAVKPAAGQSLFDGKTLAGWTITDFAGHGEVKIEDGLLMIDSRDLCHA